MKLLKRIKRRKDPKEVEEEEAVSEGASLVALISADSRTKAPEFTRKRMDSEVPQEEVDSAQQEDSPTEIRYDNVLMFFLLGNYSFYFS